MRRYWKILICCYASLLFLNGCALKTVDEMYRLPKRSETENHLQSAIDAAMNGLEYAAPVSGENQQTVQLADLDGDSDPEYLLYARGTSENPLQILIFDQSGETFHLVDRIEGTGSVFEQVEYVNIDSEPGLEIVVGKRVSDQLVRTLSVYTYSSGKLERLMSANYHKFLTCKLWSEEATQLMLIQPGEVDSDRGVAVLYSYQDGEMIRSQEAELSSSAMDVKRIMVSPLESGESAVYVASSMGEGAIITDVFAMKYGRFANISLSNESGTSVRTLRNYYVYADDIDGDGILELPDLITMKPLEQMRLANQQYLIRWYSMDINGQETDKLYTFHNFSAGWYVALDSRWANRITVSQEGNRYLFYLWDENLENCELIVSLYSFTGVERESAAQEDGRFVLHVTDDVVYAAKFESQSVKITEEDMITAFRLIQKDWKTGET